MNRQRTSGKLLVLLACLALLFAALPAAVSAAGLPKPKLVDATLVDGGIKIEWQKVSGAAGYQIYRKVEDGKWKKHATVGNVTTYKDKGLSTGTTYSYSVACLDASGARASAYSKPGLTLVYTQGKYDTPKLKKISNVASAVKLTWKAVKGAPGYRIFRRLSNQDQWKAVGETKTALFRDTTAKSDVTYTYTVCVINAAGKVVSDYDPKGLTIPFYAAPKLSSVTVQANGVLFTWQGVTGAKRYRVYRRTGSGSWQPLAYTVGEETQYLDKSVKEGKVYAYSVRAANEKGAELSAYRKPGLSITFSGQAAIAGFTPQKDGLIVRWREVTGAKKYELYRRMGGGAWKLLSDKLTTTSYKDEAVLNNTTYTYQVRALNKSGAYVGTYDAQGRSYTYLVPPTLIGCERTGSSLTTTWEAVEGASSYTIYRKIGSGRWNMVGVSAGTSYADTTMPSGTWCLYTVACNDASGNVISAYNTPGVGETSYLEMPVLLSVVNGNKQTVFTWQAVDKANYYMVYRKTGDKTTWDELGSTDQLYYIDKDVENGKKYTYTVAVCDDADELESMYNATGIFVTYYSVPKLRAVANGDMGAVVYWNMVDGASSYRVWRKTGSSAWTAIGTVGAASGLNYYIDSDVVTNGHYWYSVSALGNSESAYDTTGMDTLFIWPPAGASAAIGNGYVLVSWSNVEGIGHYRVYRRVDNGTKTGTWKVVKKKQSDLAYVDNGLISGRNYTYRICCLDDSGNEVSGYATTTTLTYLSPVTIQSLDTSLPKKVTVKWTAVTGADTYTIQMKVLGGSWTTVASGLTPLDVPKGYQVTELASGQRYWFRVIAHTGTNSSAADETGTECTVQ